MPTAAAAQLGLHCCESYCHLFLMLGRCGCIGAARFGLLRGTEGSFYCYVGMPTAALLGLDCSRYY